MKVYFNSFSFLLTSLPKSHFQSCSQLFGYAVRQQVTDRRGLGGISDCQTSAMGDTFRDPRTFQQYATQNATTMWKMDAGTVRSFPLWPLHTNLDRKALWRKSLSRWTQGPKCSTQQNNKYQEWSKNRGFTASRFPPCSKFCYHFSVQTFQGSMQSHLLQ